MQYRALHTGEIILATDEYYSYHNPEPFNPDSARFIPVKQCSVGQPVLGCNAMYYRRRIQTATTKTTKGKE